MMKRERSHLAFANQIWKRIARSFLTRNDHAPRAPQEACNVQMDET
jgi:hypothetical protein